MTSGLGVVDRTRRRVQREVQWRRPILAGHTTGYSNGPVEGLKEVPKTKRGHMIRVDSGTVGMLRRWRACQAEEKLLVGADYNDRDFVFLSRRPRVRTRLQ
jgi:hypothetical protein